MRLYSRQFFKQSRFSCDKAAITASSLEYPYYNMRRQDFYLNSGNAVLNRPTDDRHFLSKVDGKLIYYRGPYSESKFAL